ncbi:ribokinase, partial [Streptosporangium sandarakinum]
MISVFGSANMDLVAYTPVVPKRGETVTGRAFAAVPGGKGANQAVAAARAGADVAFMGAVGDDAFGPVVRETLGSAGVDVSRLRVVPGSSGVAHIVVDDDGGNSIIVVPGANGAVTAPSAEDLAVIARSDALLLQLELPIEAVVSAACQARVPVVLTPAPARELPRELLDAVDLIVPNEHEAEALTGLADPREALEALLELVPEAVITLGAEGALYGSRAGGRLRVPAVPVRAVDTTAAGDTFVGAAGRGGGRGGARGGGRRLGPPAAAALWVRGWGTRSEPGRA